MDQDKFEGNKSNFGGKKGNTIDSLYAIAGDISSFGCERTRVAKRMVLTSAWWQAPPVECDVMNAKETLAGRGHRFLPNLENNKALMQICERKVMFWWKKFWGADAGLEIRRGAAMVGQYKAYRMRIPKDGGKWEKVECVAVGISHADIYCTLLERVSEKYLNTGEDFLERSRRKQNKEEEVN